MMLSPELRQDRQVLLSRIDKKIQYRTVQKETGGDVWFESWQTLNHSKDILARELGWENYDPTQQVTDRNISSLIRQRKKAFKTGDDWDISETAQAALDSFIEERKNYQHSKNALIRHNRELNKLSGLSGYLQRGKWDDAVIDPWLEKEGQKIRHDALSKDLMGFVLTQRKNQATEVLQESISAVPEGKTRGFLNRLKNPLNKLKEVPAWAKIASHAVKSEVKHWDTTSRMLAAATAITSAALVVVVFTGAAQVADRQLYPVTPAASVSTPVSGYSGFKAEVSEGKSAERAAEAPIQVQTPQAEEKESPVVKDCPLYSAISIYRDWDYEQICQIAKTASGNNAALMQRNPDGSFNMGVLQINSEAMKKLDPDFDPEHFKKAIAEDPALGIVWAHHLYKKYGLAAFSVCLEGQIDCWPEPKADAPLVPETPQIYRQVIIEAAIKYNVPPRLMSALFQKESSYDADVIAEDNSTGIAQFQEATARELGVNPLDPFDAIKGATIYLRRQYERFGSWPVALAAYNAGPGTVEKYQGKIPDYPATEGYVRLIITRFSVLEDLTASENLS